MVFMETRDFFFSSSSCDAVSLTLKKLSLSVFGSVCLVGFVGSTFLRATS